MKQRIWLSLLVMSMVTAAPAATWIVEITQKMLRTNQQESTMSR